MVHSFHDEAASGAGKLLSSGVSGSGKYWAYCTSVEGPDWGIIRVKEVETGRELQEEIRDTKFNNSRKPITWLGNSGFFYQFWQFSESEPPPTPSCDIMPLGHVRQMMC
jgi:prolyl oligopeptidase